MSNTSNLIHLIYCSAAARPFSHKALTDLLGIARIHNARYGLTGMLLYSDGSFFQVLEGDPESVDRLFSTISRDKRHEQITMIIREPIAHRSFGNWTMGYADINPQDLDRIVGTNDFFVKGDSFVNLGAGRAKKLLEAFRQGRWRNKLSNAESPSEQRNESHSSPRLSSHTFAFQPIINATAGAIHSYEALIRGPANESAGEILRQVMPSEMQLFDEQNRIAAIELAARLGLATRLNLNFLPSCLQYSPATIASTLSAAAGCHIRPEQIILEILEREMLHEHGHIIAALREHRGTGMFFAIDDFGAGYAGLNLLAEFQPDYVKLDMLLIRGIEGSGPRQAIVRGIQRTCLDLGIDIIAECVETEAEYDWLRGEGIELFQGMLFAAPAFEQLPLTFHLPGAGRG